MLGLLWLRRQTKHQPVPAVPALRSSPKENETPWRFHAENEEDAESLYQSSYRAFFLLCFIYTQTGTISAGWESLLYALVGADVLPLTVAMHRSLVVLLGHLSWVAIGCTVLHAELKPHFFRARRREEERAKRSTPSDDDERRRTATTTTTSPRRWYELRYDTYWLWWVVGGYFVSAWAFNVADLINQAVLPARVFEEAGEGVVSTLINPENNDLAASLVGYLAPCVSAPWWEEVLYRGFMLPFFCLWLPFWPASIVSALLFSAHHMSATGFVPLTVLGMTWATLYAKCGNLFVTVLIHAMWNSRVFLGSWFGL